VIPPSSVEIALALIAQPRFVVALVDVTFVEGRPDRATRPGCDRIASNR
jgi:hypothetical protein